MWRWIAKKYVYFCFFTEQELWHRAAGFHSFSLFIFSYKAAVNLHSWNHFSVLKGLPFSKYMSVGPGNVQQAFSPDFLVVWALTDLLLPTSISSHYLSFSPHFSYEIFFLTYGTLNWKLLALGRAQITFWNALRGLSVTFSCVTFFIVFIFICLSVCLSLPWCTCFSMCVRLCPKISSTFPDIPTPTWHSSKFHHILRYLMVSPRETRGASRCRKIWFLVFLFWLGYMPVFL